MHTGQRLALQQAAEKLARQVRQQAVGEDGVDLPATALGSPTAHREAETAKAHRG